MTRSTLFVLPCRTTSVGLWPTSTSSARWNWWEQTVCCTRWTAKTCSTSGWGRHSRLVLFKCIHGAASFPEMSHVIWNELQFESEVKIEQNVASARCQHMRRIYWGAPCQRSNKLWMISGLKCADNLSSFKASVTDFAFYSQLLCPSCSEHSSSEVSLNLFTNLFTNWRSLRPHKTFSLKNASPWLWLHFTLCLIGQIDYTLNSKGPKNVQCIVRTVVFDPQHLHFVSSNLARTIPFF